MLALLLLMLNLLLSGCHWESYSSTHSLVAYSSWTARAWGSTTDNVSSFNEWALIKLGWNIVPPLTSELHASDLKWARLVWPLAIQLRRIGGSSRDDRARGLHWIRSLSLLKVLVSQNILRRRWEKWLLNGTLSIAPVQQRCRLLHIWLELQIFSEVTRKVDLLFYIGQVCFSTNDIVLTVVVIDIIVARWRVRGISQ